MSWSSAAYRPESKSVVLQSMSEEMYSGDWWGVYSAGPETDLLLEIMDKVDLSPTHRPAEDEASLFLEIYNRLITPACKATPPPERTGESAGTHLPNRM